mgnify:CR=1 FL=1
MTEEDVHEAYKNDDILALLRYDLPDKEHVEENSDFNELINTHVERAEKHLGMAIRLRRAEVARDFAEGEQ